MGKEPKEAHEFTVNSDSWVAGYRRKKGDVVILTAGQAKYEDVTLKVDAKPAEEKTPTTSRKGKAS